MIMIMTIVIKVNCYYAKKIPRILWCFLKIILFVTLTILYLEECQVTFAIKCALKFAIKYLPMSHRVMTSSITRLLPS